MWGTADFAGGSLTRRLPAFAVTLVSQAAGFALLLVAIAARGDVDGQSLGIGALAGLGGGIGLETMCVGGGQGMAMLVERLD